MIDRDKLAYEDVECVDGKTYMVVHEPEIRLAPAAFEGMTYGEVIKAIFGIKDEQIEEAKYLISIYPKGNHHDPFMAVKREVWNRPYKELSVIFGTVGVSE